MKDLARRVWLATGAAVALFAIYETLKSLLFPGMSITVSHVVTVIVVGILSYFVSQYALNRYVALLSEKDRESAKTEEINRLLSGVLATMHEAVLIVNTDMRIVLHNRAARKLVKLPDTEQSQLEGADAARGNLGPAGAVRLVTATRDPEVHEAFRRALQRKEPSEVRVEPAGTEERAYQLNVAPLGDQLAVGVFFDITRLEQLERVRREFFANLSHELRTPLTAILASSETLLGGAIDDSDNRGRFVEKLHRHAARMTELVSDISDLSAIESGQMELNLEPVRLRAVVAEVMTLLEARRNEAEINFSIDVGDQIVVTADRTRIGQVFYNLIDNAIKFNRPGGSVNISSTVSNGSLEIQVADTGVGIASADLPRIFERLYRADKSRSRRTEGTGLGLAIVKHLVQAHGGEVAVKSELGRGTCFTVTLPAVNSE